MVTRDQMRYFVRERKESRRTKLHCLCKQRWLWGNNAQCGFSDQRIW